MNERQQWLTSHEQDRPGSWVIDAAAWFTLLAGAAALLTGAL